MDGVLDGFGLVREGCYIVVNLPALGNVLVFRVKARRNRGREVWNYGPLPLDSGDSLYGYDGATTVPADGVMPARGYTGTGITFSAPSDIAGSVYDSSDIWYLPETERETLFHVHLKLRPAFMRVEVEVPLKTKQSKFQRDRVTVGVDKDLGFRRGEIEVFHFPYVHLGYLFGNDTNLDLYTHATFIYGEYVVEIPKDAETVFNVIHGKIPRYWFSMPYHTPDPGFDSALRTVYGFAGFKYYGFWEKERALAEYEEVLRGVRV